MTMTYNQPTGTDLNKLTDDERTVETVPMHTGRILVQNDDGTDRFIETILPPLIIQYCSNDDQPIRTSSMSYKVAYNRQAVPVAHIFSSSGLTCMGTIFVPTHLPSYLALYPLEAILQHNDRRLQHGCPTLPINQTSARRILDVLNAQAVQNGLPPVNAVDLHLGVDRSRRIRNLSNYWIKHDTLWRIGHYLLNTYEHDEAFKLADQLFAMVFV